MPIDKHTLKTVLLDQKELIELPDYVIPRRINHLIKKPLSKDLITIISGLRLEAKNTKKSVN